MTDPSGNFCLRSTSKSGTLCSHLTCQMTTFSRKRLSMMYPSVMADLARALVPRSITVALALPIAAQLGAPAPIVAAGVCLTGLLGANFAQSLLNRRALTNNNQNLACNNLPAYKTKPSRSPAVDTVDCVYALLI